MHLLPSASIRTFQHTSLRATFHNSSPKKPRSLRFLSLTAEIVYSSLSSPFYSYNSKQSVSTATITIDNYCIFVNSIFSRHLLLLQNSQEHIYQMRIKLCPGTTTKFFHCRLLAHRFVIRSVMHHHIVRIHHRNNP